MFLARINPRRMLAALVAIAALGLATAQAVTADGQIVINGAESGSHLRVTVSGDNIVVDGYRAPGQPIGCHPTQSRTTAVCPLAGENAIEFVMGPGNDKVEILDPLPIPTTSYLGDGSDKFIGNNEPDTCFPQGSIRNRCYGGGGNDICITGQQNSDCVGDGGNDYCRHGAGSDGCWGDCSGAPDDPCQGRPGNDVCYMGPGEDGCHGGPGNDRLYGGPQPDQLYGGPGIDYCNGGPGVGRSHGCETGPGH